MRGPLMLKCTHAPSGLPLSLNCTAPEHVDVALLRLTSARLCRSSPSCSLVWKTCEPHCTSFTLSNRLIESKMPFLS